MEIDDYINLEGQVNNFHSSEEESDNEEIQENSLIIEEISQNIYNNAKYNYN